MLDRGSKLPPATGLSQLLQEGLENNPDAPALLSLEATCSWAELDRNATALALGYRKLGLEPGDRIASLMPNRIALLAHYLACFKSGLVMTPLNYRYMPPEIDHALSVSGAKLILAHREREADLAKSKAAELPLGVIFYGGDAGTGPSFERLLASKGSATSFPEPDPASPAAIFFTSGSTGPAKGVTHTRQSLGCMFASVAAAFELSPADVVLPASSCSHVGCFAVSMAALSAGARVAVARAFDHIELGPLCREVRPTVLSMLPATLLHLIREPGTRSEDFASLRFCRSGGDKVAAELEKEFTALTGLPIREGYGMTEIGLAANNPRSGVEKLGSVGVPNPGFSFAIRDARGADVAAGEEGRVWVHTRSCATGYWNDPAASAEVIRDGWFDTGDVMKSDSDGYLWFCGRSKQIIVHDGSNIAPQEIEDALLEHPAVEAAGAIGLHDLLHGENVRAYVELKCGVKAPSAGELIAFARERIGYKAPEEIVFVPSMPLNATGKVDRTALKMLAAGEHAQNI